MEGALIGMLNDICGADLFNSIFNTLSIHIFEGEYASVWNVAAKLLNDVCKPVAIMLLFVYFMIAVIEKLTQENFTWEQFWRLMALFLASKFLMDNAMTILKLFFLIGFKLSSMAEIATGFGGDTAEEIANAKQLIASFKNGLGIDSWPSFLADLVMMIYLMIPWLIAWVMRLCVNIICYSRLVEIYVRVAFVPFALADIFHSGMHSNGVRYLKSFFAIMLQGALIIVIAAIFSELTNMIVANEQNLFAFIGAYLAFFASGIMLMFKSLSLSKEIIGVQ